MDYLKLFQTHEEYEAFVSGGTMVKPNVSHCVQENEVHYNPIETRLIVKYNVINASNPTQLYFYTSEGGITVNGELMFDKVVIDGTEVSIADLDAASGQTQLSVGEHTVKYTLKDPTFIGTEVDVETGEPKLGATFYFCLNVVSVEIPNSVTSIGDGAFDTCNSLTSVIIPNSVTTIGSRAFAECYILTGITIPNSVTSIGEYAFNLCENLENINIPSGITTIAEGAFGYTIITSITIPNTITSIGNSAFYSCGQLTSIIIQNSVTSIGENAFSNCFSLASITSLATTAPVIDKWTFCDIGENGTLYVPQGSTGYDTWMQNSDCYLGSYNWTKVEQ